MVEPSREELEALRGRFPRIRLTIVTDNGVKRPFFWFRPSGDDLYWGPSGASRYTRSAPLEGASTSFGVSSMVEVVAPPKMSFHASGQVHLKVDQRRDGPSGQLPGFRSLAEPLRIGAVLTKRVELYSPSNKDDERGGATAIRIVIPSQFSKWRLYFEFFLSPPGTFNIEAPLMVPQGGLEMITSSISPETVLVIGFCMVEQPPASDLEFWIQRYGT